MKADESNDMKDLKQQFYSHRQQINSNLRVTFRPPVMYTYLRSDNFYDIVALASAASATTGSAAAATCATFILSFHPFLFS